MPKRSADDTIRFYQEKIRKLQEKNTRNYRRLRVIDSDSSDDSEENETTNNENNHEAPPSEEEQQEMSSPEQSVPVPEVEQPSTSAEPAADSEIPEPVLDPDLLKALGESLDETPEYGSKIHENLSKIWLPLLKKGLTKENKEQLLKQYLIPENCKLLQAPKLNAEISAAVPEGVRNRDKTIMTQQQELGSGVTAINRGIDILLRGDDKKLPIQHLSNGCRILSDLHAFFTQNRIKLLTPSLDKTVLHIIQDAERDETLFGNKLSENIKAAKTIQRQGQQIKKAANPKASTSFQPQTQRNAYQGNWSAPHRYHSSRSNRGGPRRGSYQPRRPYQSASMSTTPNTSKPPPPATVSKPRAPTT